MLRNPASPFVNVNDDGPSNLIRRISSSGNSFALTSASSGQSPDAGPTHQESHRFVMGSGSNSGADAPDSNHAMILYGVRSIPRQYTRDYIVNQPVGASSNQR